MTSLSELVTAAAKFATDYDYELIVLHDADMGEGELHVGLFDDESEMVSSGTIRVIGQIGTVTVYELVHDDPDMIAGPHAEMFSTPHGLFALLYC